ncbi:calcium-dependent protein kinase 17-like [Hordeum vulgare]|nr:calcium-dependent protein kinase 17-like [Hordeum vulgare]
MQRSAAAPSVGSGQRLTVRQAVRDWVSREFLDSGNITAIFSHALHLPRRRPAILGLQPAIQVIAGCLSEEEIKGLKEMFKNIDKDNSGTIMLADADVNGLIDYEEFVNATVHMNKMDKEEHLYTTFQFFDKDYSGYITRDELEQALKEKGMYDAKEIKEIIS